ncbi:hypothetical protein FACS1894180_7550 [Bacteroidia bacterium]|nr:hypothetical protein FACS1894178_6510 [Bacteroidia bacterium]GHV45230.1 hypothetical protein FACS1894180_7550 [Bacteroidia bacterium]
MKNTGTITFDYIFTNPPWGKKLSKEERERYAHFHHLEKTNDTSSLFFIACLNKLKENGKIGFLLPEAFFNISTFEYVREKALEQKIERLIDYGKPFKGLITRAQAIILSKTNADNNFAHCEFEEDKFTRTVNSFCNTPKHIFNFWAKSEASEVIEHIFRLPHSTLKDNAEWGLGIVTGNNDKMCKTVQTEGYKPIFRGQDITPTGLKEPSLFIQEEGLSHCQQVAPIKMYKSKEKLIYRFISNKLVFFRDTEQRYILNSANMLILKEKFSVSCVQLMDLFNSDFMNWLFLNIFHTHKVLRGDLELLPIHAEYFNENKEFDENKYLNYLQIEKTNGTYRIKR